MKYILTLVLLIANLSAYDAFIKPTTLRANIKKSNLILLDVSSKDSYAKGHILSALHINIDDFMNSTKTLTQIISSSKTQEIFTNLGINNDSDIILYSRNSDEEQLNTSYFAMILILSGFENVSILNGGYMSWVFKYNRLVSSIAVKNSKDGEFKIHPNNNILVTSQYIKDNLETASIIDSRDTPYYFGTKLSKNTKSYGHISHAKSSYYKDKFLKDYTLRSNQDLVSIYVHGLMLNKNSDIIVYGNSIFDASMNWFILYQKLRLKNTKIYEASLSEWGNLNLDMTKFKWE